MEDVRIMHQFIQNHPMATLAMLDDQGRPWGTGIYVGSDSSLNLYFMTKAGTTKHRYLSKNPQVAVVYVDEESQTTLQAQGEARLVSDAQEADAAEEALTSLHRKGEEWMTPLAKLDAGEYQLYTIRVSYARMSSYGGKVMREGASVLEYKPEN